jgi:hypothetical protein
MYLSACEQRSRLAQPLDDGGVRHAAALTHRLQPVGSAALLERVHGLRHDAGTAGTQRVADRDGTAVDVGLSQISAEYRPPGPAPRDDTTAVGVDPKI